MIDRILHIELKDRLFKGKTIVVTGPRQTGKTTLIKSILKKSGKTIFLNGDDPDDKQQLQNINTEQLKRLIGKNNIMFIDEAQRIGNIGLTAKIIHDQFDHIQLILSGSSSLDLNSAINEPLTGRKWEYNLFPISWEEFQNKHGYLKSIKQLNDRLIYGMYPDVINQKGEEREVLKTLTTSYLYQDILALTNIKMPDVLVRLIQALAYQIGSEVSFNELSNMLQVNKETIASYIQLLEKAFVVFRLNPLSRNLRNEIKTNRKIYFYDNGVRNAVINAFNPIDLRNDKGALWENFLVSERIKHLSYHKVYKSYYFWRTKQQQEVDWVEEGDGAFDAFEFKWNDRDKVKFPKKFTEAYSASTQVIDRQNFVDFIT